MKPQPVARRPLEDIALARPSFLQLVADAESARGRLFEMINHRLWSDTRTLNALLAESRPGPLPLREAIMRRVRSRVRGLRPFKVGAEDAAETSCAAPLSPTVTVVLTVFNQGDELRRAIASVLQQTLPDVELIIWDDGSTNAATLSLLDSVGQEAALEMRSVRVFHEPNKGVVAARNAAADHALGEYLVFLDPDDELEQTYLEKAFLLLAATPEACIAAPHTNIRGDHVSDIWHAAPTDPEVISRHNMIPVVSMVRRESFLAVKGYAPAMAEGFEDWELWVRMTMAGHQAVVLDDPLLHYSYSVDSGRNSTAMKAHDELVRLIRHQNPRRGPRVSALPERRLSVGAAIRSYNWNLRQGLNRPVVFFVPWLIRGGGAENFLLTLTQGLSKSGRTVVFVSTNTPPVGSIDGKSAFYKVTPYVYDLPSFLSEDDYGAFIHSLLGRMIDPCVVNVGCAWLYHAFRSSVVDDANRYHIIDVLFNPVGHLPSFLREQDHFSAVIGVYSALGDLLASYFRVRPPVYVVPVGISAPDQIAPSTRVGAERLKVGWLGRLSSEKRPLAFCEIARAVSGGVDCVIAGSGPMETEVRGLAGSVSGLEFVGFVESAEEFLSGIDILVNTSEIEGISVTAMEALALGKPVIATGVGGMPELVRDGENGFVVDTSHVVEETVARIRELASDHAKWDALRATVETQRLESAFDAKTMIRTFEAIFDMRELPAHTKEVS